MSETNEKTKRSNRAGENQTSTASRACAPSTPAPAGKSKRLKSEGRTALFLILPTLVVVGIVIVWPTIAAIWNSFFGEPPLGQDGFYETHNPFVGLGNYASLFTDDGQRFWNAMLNTTFFGVVTVILEVVLGIIMALIMNRAMKGRGLVRAAILIPWAIPTAVSATLWKWIFDANGAANALLGTDTLWAVGNWSAKFAIVIADVWKTAPFVALLTLAGLQVIPESVYEAAKLDGANAWKRFMTITLPLVKPALVVAVLFRALDALRMFDLPYILIGPRKDSVETMSMLVQDEATNARFGSASAYAIILFLYVFIVAIAFIKILGADVIGDGGSRGSRGGAGKTSNKLRLFRYKKQRPARYEAKAETRARGVARTSARAGARAGLGILQAERGR